MPFNSSNLTRDAILSRYFPHYAPVASQHVGLSGGSCLISDGQQTLVLRHQHQAAPASFLRQYRLLRHLPATIAPQPLFFAAGWMAIDYIPGTINTALPQADALARLLYDLHRQKCFGWRITLLPLLERDWQCSAPARRTPFWLRQLKRLRRQREPLPLRLAPLHMDVHAGNIVHGEKGLRLIDWEYAGDGDVALELAGIWCENEAQRRDIAARYAGQANIDPPLLWRQVKRWRPWVLMLMVGWYERRWQQTGDQQFIMLANEIWRQLQSEG